MRRARKERPGGKGWGSGGRAEEQGAARARSGHAGVRCARSARTTLGVQSTAAGARLVPTCCASPPAKEGAPRRVRRAMAFPLLIKPRLQKEKFSIYWKTSMTTYTVGCPPAHVSSRTR
eukprot:scaffold1445_cov255-Prasinococcus_capsulatus_cf.AAC.3